MDFGSLNLTNFAHTIFDDSQVRIYYEFWMLSLMIGSRKTLRHLKLGRDVSPVSEDLAIADNTKWDLRLLRSFLVRMGGRPVQLLKLSSLHLTGILSTKLENGNLFEVTSLPMLRSLCLESCTDAAQALKMLTCTPGISLKRFWLRHEGQSADLVASLELFLESFSGLEHLYILLDNVEAIPDSACFVSKHSESLKTLVWEGRRGPRVTFQDCTSICYSASDTKQIDLIKNVSACTELEELGLAFDWSRQRVRKAKQNVSGLALYWFKLLSPAFDHSTIYVSIPEFSISMIPKTFMFHRLLASQDTY